MPTTELKRRALELPVEWQKQLLDERMEQADRDPAVWIPWEDVEQEVRETVLPK